LHILGNLRRRLELQPQIGAIWSRVEFLLELDIKKPGVLKPQYTLLTIGMES
jgi:hypothetical protein